MVTATKREVVDALLALLARNAGREGSAPAAEPAEVLSAA